MHCYVQFSKGKSTLKLFSYSKLNENLENFQFSNVMLYCRSIKIVIICHFCWTEYGAFRFRCKTIY